MTNRELADRSRKAIEEYFARSDDEVIDSLISLGTIDRQGRVLMGNEFGVVLTNVWKEKQDRREICHLLIRNVLDMMAKAYGREHYGPFVLTHSHDWDACLDDDHWPLGAKDCFQPTRTLRQRIKDIEGINDVRRDDKIPNGCMDLLEGGEVIVSAKARDL